MEEPTKCCICLKETTIKAIGCKDTYICPKCIEKVFGGLRRKDD